MAPEGDDESRIDDDGARPPPRRYESPRITWREPYEPLSFGLSCAKQPGNPGCGFGPYSA